MSLNSFPDGGRPRPRHAALPALRHPWRRQAGRRAAPAARRVRPRPPPGGHPACVPQAGPAPAREEPGDVRRRDHRGPRHPHRHRQRHRLAAGGRPGRPGVPGPDRGLALVHRPLRHLRRGRRRGSRAGPGGDAAPDALGDHGPPAPGRRVPRERGLVRAPQGRHRRGRGRRDDPRRRRRDRGRRLRQRGGHHRRIRAGPQGARDGHPLERHRRDDAHQRPAGHPRHHRSRRDLPRPDDRPRRGGEAPAHAQRDRARDPAGRPDDRLPDGDRDPAAVRALRRHDRRHGGPRRPPGLPHPDDDRRPPVGHRHRRHGPGGPLQRAGHERPGRRGVGRRRRHPARQDRHDHLRQPAGRVDHAGARGPRAGGGHRRPRLLDPGRDARGPLDRRAGPQAPGRAGRPGRHRRRGRVPEPRRRGRRVHALPGRDPHERRPALIRPDGPQGGGRRHRRRARRRHAGRARRGHRPDRRRRRDAPRDPPGRPRPRPHRAQGHRQGGPARSASPSSGRWASGPSW